MFKKFNFVSTSEPMDALQALIHDFSFLTVVKSV